MARRLAAVGLALALAACGGSTTVDPDVGAGPGGSTGPTGPTAPSPSVLVAGGRAGPWTVELRSDRPLGTGIASLAVHVTGEGGAVVADASLAFEARRPATGLVAPVTNGPRIGADGAYHLDVSIAEAASVAAGWTFRVEVTRAGEQAVATFAGLPVADRRLAGTFTDGDKTTILAVRFEAGPWILLSAVLVFSVAMVVLWSDWHAIPLELESGFGRFLRALPLAALAIYLVPALFFGAFGVARGALRSLRRGGAK